MFAPKQYFEHLPIFKANSLFRDQQGSGLTATWIQLIIT